MKTNAAVSKPSPNTDDPSAFNYHFADVNGIRLHYVEEGKGPQTVKLDIYEGMRHNFASRIPEAPESKLARGTIGNFVALHLA
jgi:hypothetical protein